MNHHQTGPGPRVNILASTVLLLWAVFGGLFIYFYLANFITVLLRPRLDQPFNSAQDVVDRGLIPFTYGTYYQDVLLRSPNPLYRQLGEQLIVHNSEDPFYKMLKEDVLISNTHVFLGMLMDYEKAFGNFYTSKDVLEGSTPFSVNIVNTKWEFKDVFLL